MPRVDKPNVSPVAEIFEEYRDVLERSVTTILRRKDRAEDVVQEAFRLAYEREKSTKIDHPKSYLHITARRLAIRENTRISEKLTDYMEDTGVSDLSSQEQNGFDKLAGDERMRLLAEAIDSLPSQCKKAFTLRLKQGLSYKQIAERMGISVSTAEKHLAKALRLCSERVRSGGDRSKVQ